MPGQNQVSLICGPFFQNRQDIADIDILVFEKFTLGKYQISDNFIRGGNNPALGPDENMHDEMIELIAAQSLKRGYILGSGVISSKAVGINHKEYGVTSLGVITFAEITMAELGIDMSCDSYSVKFTGGPNGDVAGNAMRLLLERSPQVKIVLIVAGSGVLYDPAGSISHIKIKKSVDETVLKFVEALEPRGLLR